MMHTQKIMNQKLTKLFYKLSYFVKNWSDREVNPFMTKDEMIAFIIEHLDCAPRLAREKIIFLQAKRWIFSNQFERDKYYISIPMTEEFLRINEGDNGN